MSASNRLTASAAVAAALLLAATSAAAGPFDNDIRIKAGIYSPVDLPTNSGPIYAIEVRNRVSGQDGIYYGLAIYDDQRSVQRRIGANDFQLDADIKLLPISVGWYHFWDTRLFSFYGGGGLGLYEVDAFSGGFSKQAGAQVVDIDEFRVLSDDSRAGLQIFAGADYLPESRIGAMLEVRLHVVEDDFGGAELSTGAVFRF